MSRQSCDMWKRNAWTEDKNARIESVIFKTEKALVRMIEIVMKT